MAADLLIEMKDNKDFMERLRSSSMIEIKCPKDILKPELLDVIIRVPEAIACSLSGRISKLVNGEAGTTKNISIQELMGGAEPFYDFDARLGDNTAVLSYLTWFIQWVYTSKLNYDKDLRIFEMWVFASIIECPRLQDEAAKMLSRDAFWRSNVDLGEKKLQYRFANYGFMDTIQYCAEMCGIHPRTSVKRMEDIEIEVPNWENKTCLLFLLDCAAYFGPGDHRVREVLCEDQYDNLSVLVMKRMIQRAKDGGEMCPWDPKNIGRYLLTEQHARSTMQEAPVVQTPLRKRLAAPLGSINGNKRMRLSSRSIIKQSSSAEKRFSDVSHTLVGDGEELNIAN